MIPDFSALSVGWNVALFLAATLVVTLAGIKMAGAADRLADISGLGEAVTGALFLGASTSLSGIVTSVTAAAEGHPHLAMSNAIGGIAAQTVFLAAADFAYRRANLEHAAASLANLMAGCLLIGMLTLPLLAYMTPEISYFGMHPVTPVIPIAYGLGLILVSRARDEPMWGPRRTRETKEDEPDEAPSGGRTLLTVILTFLLLAVLVGSSGFVIAQTGLALSEQAGISEGVVGTLFTAVATSTPELVTTIAAVRRGALTLAVGGILGGNAFDVLLAAFSDAAYREGSIYHAVGDQQLFIVALSILMTVALLLGLLRRERHGVANVGFETLLMLAVYAGGMAVLVFAGGEAGASVAG